MPRFGGEWVAHRAALYTVQVRERRAQGYRLLGDIDDAGTWLGDVLHASLTGLTVPSEDGTKSVVCNLVSLNGEEVRVLMRHGENGVAADIVNQAGAQAYRQRASDTQLVRCAGLFVLPSAQDRGWLALHVNFNRGVKTLLVQGLLEQFADRHQDLILDIKPFVTAAAFHDAVNKGRITNIRLVKIERPDNRAVAATSRWVEAGVLGTIEVKITAGRAQRLLPAPLRRYLHGNDQQKAHAFNQIVEFNGMAFDEAKVEVELENGTHRTFNIEQPTSGHPMTIDLDDDLATDNDGDPTDASL
jgi:hypothetical protein